MRARRIECRRVAMVGVAGLMAATVPHVSLAQSASATATMTMPAVAHVRSTSMTAARRIGEQLIEVTQRVITSANASYSLMAVRSADNEIATGERAHVFARGVNGEFVPVEAGSRVLVSRGARGEESVTTVVLRVETRGVDPSAVLRRIAFEATAEAR